MKSVCCQEQEVQPYLDADVTCNLTEGGREVMSLPTRPGVDAMGCLSAGQGVVGSRVVGSSAFSPGTKGKGSTVAALARNYTLALWTGAGCLPEEALQGQDPP